MHRLQAISEMLIVCFARGLSFDEDNEYFVRFHDAKCSGPRTRRNPRALLRRRAGLRFR